METSRPSRLQEVQRECKREFLSLAHLALRAFLRIEDHFAEAASRSSFHVSGEAPGFGAFDAHMNLRRRLGAWPVPPFTQFYSFSKLLNRLHPLFWVNSWLRHLHSLKRAETQAYPSVQRLGASLHFTRTVTL